MSGVQKLPQPNHSVLIVVERIIVKIELHVWNSGSRKIPAHSQSPKRLVPTFVKRRKLVQFEFGW